jgi:hypothetical protein
MEIQLDRGACPGCQERKAKKETKTEGMRVTYSSVKEM